MRGDAAQVKGSWHPDAISTWPWVSVHPQPGASPASAQGQDSRTLSWGSGASTLPDASPGASTRPGAGVECSWLLGITCGLWLSPTVKQARLTCPETHNSLAATAQWRPQASQCQPRAGRDTPRG